jgi:hypothetical protein
MKTGDILLVSSQSDRAKLIQKFQKKTDPVSGKWNHSGIIIMVNGVPYVYEAAEVEGRKIKAAIILTDMNDYLSDHYDLRVVEAPPVNEAEFIRLAFKYLGTPYDYFALIHDQVVRTLFNRWVGKIGIRASKRMLCHEATMFIWNEYRPGTFPEWYAGDVAKIYHSKLFT